MNPLKIMNDVELELAAEAKPTAEEMQEIIASCYPQAFKLTEEEILDEIEDRGFKYGEPNVEG